MTFQLALDASRLIFSNRRYGIGLNRTELRRLRRGPRPCGPAHNVTPRCRCLLALAVISSFLSATTVIASLAADSTWR